MAVWGRGGIETGKPFGNVEKRNGKWTKRVVRPGIQQVADYRRGR